MSTPGKVCSWFLDVAGDCRLIDLQNFEDKFSPVER